MRRLLPRALPSAPLIALIVLMLPSGLEAQIESWNRKIDSVIVVPSPGDTTGTKYDILVEWFFELSGADSVQNLACELQLSVTRSGLSIVDEISPWNIKEITFGACADTSTDSCGVAKINGTFEPLACEPTEDLCRSPELERASRRIVLQPGDRIDVILRRVSPGLAEVDTSDDTFTALFEAVPVRRTTWGRIKTRYEE